MYLNYGATVALAPPTALLLPYRFTAAQLVGPLIAFGLLFPALFFRRSRALWLAVETRLRPSTFDRSRDTRGVLCYRGRESIRRNRS